MACTEHDSFLDLKQRFLVFFFFSLFLDAANFLLVFFQEHILFFFNFYHWVHAKNVYSELKDLQESVSDAFIKCFNVFARPLKRNFCHWLWLGEVLSLVIVLYNLLSYLFLCCLLCCLQSLASIDLFLRLLLFFLQPFLLFLGQLFAILHLLLLLTLASFL